jgi:hypothetical protein
LQVCHVSATQAFINGCLQLAGLSRICNTSFHSWGSSTSRFATYLQHKLSFTGVFHLQVCHVSAKKAFIHGALPLAGLPRFCNISFRSWGTSTCRFATYLQHTLSFMGVFHLQVGNVSATQAFMHGGLPLAGLPRICNTSFHSWGVLHLQVCHVSAKQAFNK